MKIEIEIPDEKFMNKTLENFKAEFPERLDSALRWAADYIHDETVQRSPVGRKDDPRPGHPGYFKSSWSNVQKRSSGYSFSNKAPYAGHLEYGLYPGVGPRTVRYKGGIYSKQAPGGVARVFLDDEKHMDWLTDKIFEKLRESFK